MQGEVKNHRFREETNEQNAHQAVVGELSRAQGPAKTGLLFKTACLERLLREGTVEQDGPKESERMNHGKHGAGEEGSSQGKILEEQIGSWPRKTLKLLLLRILSCSSLAPSGLEGLVLG